MKIYVGNLPFSFDDNALKGLFTSYGEVQEATIIKDKFSNRSKGFGFVTMSDDEAAKTAIAKMHEKEVEGRKLTVNEAKPMEERPRRDFNDRDSRGPSRGFGGNNRSSGGRSFGNRDSNSRGSSGNRSSGGSRGRY